MDLKKYTKEMKSQLSNQKNLIDDRYDFVTNEQKVSDDRQKKLSKHLRNKSKEWRSSFKHR